MQDQNRLNRYKVDYKGYSFEFDAYKNPTLEEIHKLYMDNVVNNPDYNDYLNNPKLDLEVETDEEASKSNNNLILNEEMPVDANAFGRLTSSFVSALPFANPTNFTPAESSLELISESIGQLSGTIASLYGGGQVVGAYRIAKGAPWAVNQANKLQSLYKKAAKYKKAGDTSNLTRTGLEVKKEIAVWNKMLEKSAKAGYGTQPHLSTITKGGILGKSKIYQDTIRKIAQKNPGHANALNLFANNLGTISLYGQTKVQSYGQIKNEGLSLEGRLERLTDDAISSALFTAAGLPRMYGYQGKGVKRLVEPSMVFGAGAFSDLGRDETLNWGDRFTNGAVFMGLHYARLLFPHRQIKEKISEAIVSTDPNVSQAQLRKLMGSKGMDRIIELSIKEAFKNPTYTNKSNTNKQVQILRIEAPKEGKTKNHRVVLSDLNTGEITAVEGNSKIDALKNLDKKYSRNVPPIRDTVKGEALKDEDKAELKTLNEIQLDLKDAIMSNRKIEAFPLPRNQVEKDLIDPLISKSFETSQAISKGSKKISNSSKKSEGRFEVGDFVKIPYYDTNTKKIDYSKSSIGTYVGKLGDLTKSERSEVIMPDWMIENPKGMLGFNHVTVFDIQTHGGSRKSRIAIGDDIPRLVEQNIKKANSIDRPALEYAEENPNYRKLTKNPIVSIRYAETPMSPDPIQQILEKSRSLREVPEYNYNSPLFKELFIEKPRGGQKNKIAVNVKKPLEVSTSNQEKRDISKKLGFFNTQKKGEFLQGSGKFGMKSGATPEENLESILLQVTDYKRRWDENQGSYYGAKTKKPYLTADFARIYNDAKKLGYKGKISELYNDFKVGGEVYNKFQKKTITQDTPFYFYAPSRLKKIKLSNGEKAFPDGVVTPQLAKNFQKDRQDSIVQEVGEKMDIERQKFAQLKGADIDDWPNMNNMDKNAPMADDVYDNYPQFNPENELGWGLNMIWDSRSKNKIVPKTFESKQRFKTKEEAEKWGSDHWLDTDMLEKAIGVKTDKINAIKGPKLVLWEKQRRQLKTAQKEAKLTDEVYKDFLRLVYPESGGSSKNMTFDELQSATFLLSNEGYNDFYNGIISSITPLDEITIKPSWTNSKILQETLPAYTIMLGSNSKTANDVAYNLINHDLMRQRIVGSFTDFKAQLIDSNPKLKKTKVFKELSTIIEEKFADFKPSSMDNLENQEVIKKTINDFFDKSVAMMIESGVPVKNLKNNNFEPFFESYYDGKLIELANGYDAIRIVKGIDFLDNFNNSIKPLGLDKDLKNMIKPEPLYKRQGKKQGKEFVHLKNIDDNQSWISKEFPTAINYIKGLKRLNEDTGKYEGGWFIVDKTRYNVDWTNDGKSFTITRLGPTVVEQKGVSGEDRFVVFSNKNGKVGQFNTHIQKSYLPRVISNNFIKKLNDEKFERELISFISQNEPSILKAKSKGHERLELARDFKKKISSVYASDSKVHGTQHTRIASLPPVYVLEKGTKKIISLKTYRDTKGNPVSKNSTVLDTTGVFRKVGEVVDVYERDFNKILGKYGQGVAHISSTSKLFGHKGAESEIVAGKGGMIDKIKQEQNDEFGNWVHKIVRLQLNSTAKGRGVDLINAITNYTAQTGLSWPVSGAKNLILGQAAIAQSVGFRLLAYSWIRALKNPKAMSTLTGRIGGKDAGVHELITGAISYNKLNPGLMRPSEIINRITGVAVGEPALLSSIDNINGIKGFLNTGVSKETSMIILKDFLKMTDKDIEDAIRLGSERIHERPDLIERSQQLGHIITQGGPKLPFVPPVFASQYASPLTLFYKIGYTITGNLNNYAIKPLILDGNPFGMLRWTLVAGLAGEAIVGLYYHVSGTDVVNRFKSKAGQLFDALLAAEMFAVLTGMFDEDRDFTESYWPAIVKTVESAATNVLSIAYEKKTVGQSLNDFAKETIALYSNLLKKWELLNKPVYSQFKKSRRRQRQWLDRYLSDEKNRPSELDQLTLNSPQLRIIRESFWLDKKDEEKARVYASAVAQISTQIHNDNHNLGMTTNQAIKKAKSLINSVISRQRPIPSSWRKKTKGTRTRWDLYMNRLKEINPKLYWDEIQIEKDYKNRKIQWNSAISKNRRLQFIPLPEENKKPKKFNVKSTPNLQTPVQLPDDIKEPKIKPSGKIVDTGLKNYSGNRIRMDKVMVKPFLKASQELKKLGINLQVEDTFRYKSVQKEMYDKSFGTNKEGLVAHPDSSFHPKGLAFDLAQIKEMKNPKVKEVLKKVGFIQSRPDDEWWHWSLP